MDLDITLAVLRALEQAQVRYKVVLGRGDA